MFYKKKYTIKLLILSSALTFVMKVNAQEVRVIDNKGTINNINKVSYGTTAPTLTSPSDNIKGDTYIIGTATNPEKIFLFDGTQWVETSAHNWLLKGNSGTNPATNFLGTTDAQNFILKANNTERIRLRQDLGQVLINNANNFDFSGITGPSLVLRANGTNNELFGLQNTAGDTEWHINLRNGGFNFAETGVHDGRFYIQNGGNVGIDTDTPNSRLQINGSVAKPIDEVTTALTLNEEHYTLVLNGNHNITLPNANTCSGRIYIIKNTFDTRPTISNYIDNNGSSTTEIPNKSVIKIQSDGTNWHLISHTKTNKINFGGRWTNNNASTSTNLNTPAFTVVPIFGSQNYNDDSSLYNTTSTTLTINETGRYDIRANIALVSDDNSERTNVNARLFVGTNAVGAFASTGYIRYRPNNSNRHISSSLHINEILQLNAGDVITIQTIMGANSGNVIMNGAGSSSFTINKIR